MKNVLNILVCLVLANLFVVDPACAQSSDYPVGRHQSSIYQTDPFQIWLQKLRDDAIADGVSPTTVETALQQISLDERVVARDHNQPETTQSFSAYSTNTVSTDRVVDGRILYKKYGPVLRVMYDRYGVPPEIVVALWGMESNFGRNSGDFETVSALATLAYESHRGNFFRQQLISALHILDQEHMQISELRGSWAGAMGQPQFMPTTYLRYAVDYDGSGRRDIWTNETDVFASIAHYLAAEGWKRGTSWGKPVKVTKSLSETSTGLDHKRTVAAWGKLGVRGMNGKPLPKSAQQAALVQPDGLGGRSFLVYDNFRALMRWNRSTYFATSVGLLADRIANR